MGGGLLLCRLDCSTCDAGAGWEDGCEPDGGTVCLLRGWRLTLVSGFLGDIYDTGEDFRRGRDSGSNPNPCTPFWGHPEKVLEISGSQLPHPSDRHRVH